VPERRSIQSVAVHLMGLCMVIERGWSPEAATRRIGGLVERARPGWLSPPVPNGTLTVEYPLAAPPDEHARRVREWAEDVWAAWQPHHPVVHAWLDSYL
jgi:hypothetical protein